MKTVKLRDYVIIGEQPDGTPVILKHTTTENGFKLYDKAIEDRCADEFRARYPEAKVIRQTHSGGTGGAGWSCSYEMELGE